MSATSEIGLEMPWQQDSESSSTVTCSSLEKETSEADISSAASLNNVEQEHLQLENSVKADKDQTKNELCQENIILTNENSAFLSSKETLTIFQCKKCTFKTTKKHLIKVHNISHSEPKAKNFPCPDCDYSTPHKHNLRTHLKKHTDISELEESEIFRCEKCDYKTQYKHDLHTHYLKHNAVKPFKCELCDFSTIYRHSLLHHVDSKHAKLRPFKCSICSYSCARKQDLATHEARHASDKPYRCHECLFATAYKQSLRSHMKRHSGIDSKIYECTAPECTYRTQYHQNLRSHLLTHSSDKPFQCKFCGFVTAHKKQLKVHEKKHTDGQPKIYKCDLCPFTTAQRFSLKRHVSRHQPDRKMPEKSFVCEHCGYCTAYKNSLKRHTAKHSSVKPFKCGHCDYSAINMSQMRVHIAKHTGVKPFVCTICDYKTANKQHLLAHAAKHSSARLGCSLCNYQTAWRSRMRAHMKAHDEGKILTTLFGGSRVGFGNTKETSETSAKDDKADVGQCDNSPSSENGALTVTTATEEELQQISQVIASHTLLTEQELAQQDSQCQVEVSSYKLSLPGYDVENKEVSDSAIICVQPLFTSTVTNGSLVQSSPKQTDTVELQDLPSSSGTVEEIVIEVLKSQGEKGFCEPELVNHSTQEVTSATSFISENP